MRAARRREWLRVDDLTVAKGGEPADVLRVSLLGNQDSSHVYFVAKGVLAANKRQYADSEGKEVEEGAVNGERNLYVWDDGTVTYIATFGEGDTLAGDASPDGAWFAFDSSKSLTGYDNTPSAGGSPVKQGPVQEIFLYSAASQQLLCASCNPSGEAPVVGSAGADLGSFARRPLSDGGRLFFETKEALLPADTNGQVDVYEYEGGHVYPISSGTSPRGIDVRGRERKRRRRVLPSTQQLVPQDTQAEANGDLRRARRGRLPRTCLAAAVHDRRRLPCSGRAVAVGLWRAGERRRSPGRATSRHLAPR